MLKNITFSITLTFKIKTFETNKIINTRIKMKQGFRKTLHKIIYFSTY